MSAMRPIARRLTRLTLTVALVIGVVTFPAGWGSRLGERVLRKLTPLRHLPELTFRIAYLSPTRAEIEGIRLGDEAGAPAVRQIEARYSPRSLMQRTIRSVHIKGLSGTFIQTSNSLSLPGRELIRQLLPADGRSAPSGGGWRLLTGEILDLQVKLRAVADDDETPLQTLSGTLRVEWKTNDSYRLAWSGLLFETPAWLNGELNTAALDGQISFAAPLVSSQRIRQIAQRITPQFQMPPVHGSLSLSLAADMHAGKPREVTLLAMTEGPWSYTSDNFALRLADVVAAGQWQLGDGMPGRLRDVTVEATLEASAGLPPALAGSVAGARASWRLDDVALSADPPQPFRIRGELTLPHVARWTSDDRTNVEMSFSASPTQILLIAESPALAGRLQVGDAPADWRVGPGSLRVQADLQDDGGGWRFAGSANLAEMAIRHREFQVDQAFLRLPIAGSVAPSRYTEAHLEVLQPRIGWSQAQVFGVELLATNLVPPTVTSAEPLRLAAAFRVTAPQSFARIDVGVSVSETGDAAVTLNQPLTPIGMGDPLLERLLVRFAPALITGNAPRYSARFGIDAACDISRGGAPVWRFDAVLDEAAVWLTDPFPLDLSGLSTTVRLDGAGTRWRMRPVESVFTNAMAGGLGIRGGRIRWRLDEDELMIEQAEFDWCGGKARLYAVRVDLARPDVDLILYIDSIDAGELFKLIKPLQGTATGRLYGRIPLRIRNGRILLSEGFLYALPGEGGNLRLRNTQFLQDYLAKAGLSAAIRKNVADALADLQYTVLRFDLSSLTAREAKLVMKLAGRAVRDQSLPPVDLDIRVNGPLEALLNLGLQMNSGGP